MFDIFGNIIFVTMGYKKNEIVIPDLIRDLTKLDQKVRC